MKEYKKFIKKLLKDKDFHIEKTTRKTTVKLTHIPTNKMYSIHPGDKAVKPLQNWIRNL
jgi:hypothetical protein